MTEFLLVAALWATALAAVIYPRAQRPTPWHAIAENPIGLGIDMGAFHSERAAELHANDHCPAGMVWRVVHEDDMAVKP